MHDHGCDFSENSRGYNILNGNFRDFFLFKKIDEIG